MKNLFSTTSARARTVYGDPAGGALRRIRRARYAPPPPLEEALARMRGYRSLLSRLTPEQWAAIKAYDGPEILGDSRSGPQRTF
jgi:hypothetical protein